jgi:hypothetical protein
VWDLVDDVLLETRSKEKRQRLFFGEAYEEVMRKMVGLRLVSARERGWLVPTASALCQARQRLGEEPLRQLFERAAAPLATGSTIGAWLSHRWRLMAIDGVTLDVPDTAENEKAFGRPSSRTGQGGAFPQVRVVGLGECGTHAIVAADLGPIRVGERELAERLLVDLDQDMLVMFDRGFFSYDLFTAARDTGADLLFRVSSQLTLPVLARLPDDSYLSAITGKGISAPTSMGEARWRVANRQAALVRVVEYQITDRPTSEVYRLITTITDWRSAVWRCGRRLRLAVGIRDRPR